MLHVKFVKKPACGRGKMRKAGFVVASQERQIGIVVEMPRTFAGIAGNKQPAKT